MPRRCVAGDTTPIFLFGNARLIVDGVLDTFPLSPAERTGRGVGICCWTREVLWT